MKKSMIVALAALLLLSACAKPAPADPQLSDTTGSTEAPATTEPAQTQPTTVPEPTDPREVILGDWSYEIAVDSSMVALPDFDGTVAYPLVWSFREDGTVAVMEDREAYLTAIAQLEEKLVDFMVDSRYALFVSESNYHGRYDDYIEKEWVTNGLGEQVRQEMADSVTALQLSVRCAPARFLGTYTLDGEWITVTDSEGGSYLFRFSVSQEALILTPEEDNLLLQELNLPQPLILMP